MASLSSDMPSSLTGARLAGCIACLLFAWPSLSRADEIVSLGQLFDLPTLHYVAYEMHMGRKVAWLRPDCGRRFALRKGDYIGRNEGRITRITEKAIAISELIPDGQGGWIERSRFMRRELSKPFSPSTWHYVAHEKSGTAEAAWIQREGCPKVRVLAYDYLGDDKVQVEGISPIEVKIGWFDRPIDPDRWHEATLLLMDRVHRRNH